MPSESDWPEDIPLPWSSFKISRRYQLENLVPNMESCALELMKVKPPLNIVPTDIDCTSTEALTCYSCCG